jgi:hypothetical protein
VWGQSTSTHAHIPWSNTVMYVLRQLIKPFIAKMAYFGLDAQ